MSQTSTERLRDYLAQLPPQAQALLMREFERAIERGEDTAVATFVLEQLRKVVRGTDEESPAAHRRSGPAAVPPARAVSRRRQFSRCGRARSAARRCCRYGSGWSATARRSRRGNSRRRWQGCGKPERPPIIEVGGPQVPARRGGCDLQDRHAGARRRPAARAGPRRPAQRRSRICCRSARCCRPAKRWIPSAAGSPVSCGSSRMRRSPRSARRSTFPRCRRRSCCRSRCRW